MSRLTKRARIHKVRLVADAEASALPVISVARREDQLAAEEPLEIRIGDEPFSVTMRTPGDDFDLVAGFLVSEGVIADAAELISLRFCAGEDENGQQTFNVVQAQLRPGVQLPDLHRHVYTTSSCGICGTASIEAVRKVSRFSQLAQLLMAGSVNHPAPGVDHRLFPSQ